MKKIKLLLSLIYLYSIAQTLQAQIVYIPDFRFKEILVYGQRRGWNDVQQKSIDINKDKEIQVSEAEKVDSLDLFYSPTYPTHSQKNEAYYPISNLKGIEAFKSLTYLNIECNQVTELDLSQNENLKVLNCNNNLLVHLNISKNVKLNILYCENNKLTRLYLKKNINLTQIVCSRNYLSVINFSENKSLRQLYCNNNRLHSLIFAHDNSLKRINCEVNQINALDLSSSPKLVVLNCFQNRLRNLDIRFNAIKLRKNGSKNLGFCPDYFKKF